MAVTTRDDERAILYALVKANNDRQIAAVSTNFHYDITQVTTGSFSAPAVANDTPALSIGAAPTDSTTCISFTNGLKKLINRHFADVYAHKVVTTAVATANATDITTAIALGNALKTAYTTGGHIGSTTYHANADATNTIAAANATDQTTLITLLTEMRTDVGAHIISAPSGEQVRIVSA